jgi:streptomycin 6-kinase
MMPDAVLQTLLSRWKLAPDGDAIATPGSHLLPVRWQGRAAMLKIAHQDEERQGGAVMA